ncbi:hypothetical protein P3G55_16690 [Leptospira sp. 96542]|nr:hypothetical protein [Leptospira sp. 96542]
MFGETKTNSQMFTVQEKMPMFKEGEYILSAEEGVTESELRALFEEFGILKLESLIIQNRSYLLQLKTDPGLTTLQRKTTAFGRIRYIERNQILQKYKTKP